MWSLESKSSTAVLPKPHGSGNSILCLTTDQSVSLYIYIYLYMYFSKILFAPRQTNSKNPQTPLQNQLTPIDPAPRHDRPVTLGSDRYLATHTAALRSVARVRPSARVPPTLAVRGPGGVLLAAKEGHALWRDAGDGGAPRAVAQLPGVKAYALAVGAAGVGIATNRGVAVVRCVCTVILAICVKLGGRRHIRNVHGAWLGVSFHYCVCVSVCV
jgi:hypothetical protein